MFKSFNNDKSALYLALGTKVGVGSIIGASVSFVIGGLSSILWMNLFSIITSSIIYYEAYLGRKYALNGIGGFHKIIEFKLGNKLLSLISLIILIVTYSFAFQMIQINTISNLVLLNININKTIVIILFAIILIITISCSYKDIIKILNKIVPIMFILFIIVCLYGIISNIELLLLSLKSVISKTTITSFFTGMIIGVKRSIFANELLVGTTSMSSSIDKSDINNSSYIQVLGVYIINVISILICLLLLIYTYSNNINIDYLKLINDAVYFTTNKVCLLFFIISVILFAVTTILSGYYIGITNIKYKKTFKFLFVLFCLLGTLFNIDLLWKIVDFLLLVAIIINSYSIINILRRKHD